MRVVPWVIVLALAVPHVAEAGRTQYGWLFGSEVLPEGGVEIQTWTYEKNGREDVASGKKLRETLFWWGALVGVTDNFELVFPVEFIWKDVDEATPSFTIEKFGIEARYRFVKTDAEHPDGVAPLFRVAAKRDVTTRDATIAEADAIVSLRSGRVHALADLGVTAQITPNTTHLELRPGAGISIDLKDELRLGVEGYGEIFLDSDLKKASWFGVGPNMSWTKGRFWISGSFLVGVYQIDTAPRVLWGILF